VAYSIWSFASMIVVIGLGAVVLRELVSM